MGEPLWHLLGVDEAAQRLDSDRLTGLTADEALRRRQLHGPNELSEAKQRGAVAMQPAAGLATPPRWHSMRRPRLSAMAQRR